MSATGTLLESLVLPVASWDPAREAPSKQLTYVDLSSVDRDTKEITYPQRLSGSEAPSRARQLLRAGDVLVSTVRPNLNAVAQVPTELDGATGSTGFCVLRADEKALFPRYLYYWVRTPYFVAEMVRRATGASYPAVSDKTVRGSKIPLPSIPEQRRIAAILDRADAVRRKRQQTLDLADQFLRSAFLDMFGDPVTNPKGWPVVTLANLVAGPVRNGLSPSGTGTYAGEVLTLAAITGFHFEPECRKTAFFDLEPPTEKMVDSRDFLICRGNGNVEMVGRGAFPTASLPGVLFPDTMIGFRLDLGRVAKSYLQMMWQSAAVRAQIAAKERTTSGIHKVNQQTLKSTKFPLAPIDQQLQLDKIASRVSDLRKQASGNLSTALMDSLTQRAFRGDVRQSTGPET